MKFFVMAVSLAVLVSCASVSINRDGAITKASFKISGAKQVSLYTSADGYTEMKGIQSGDRWSFSMPGSNSFRYFLKKDGETYLPPCAMTEDDGFGGRLCVYEEE